MQFTPRNRGNTFWRNDYQPPRRAERAPQSREWTTWNSPKTHFSGRPKYQYRGPNARGYHHGSNQWSGYSNGNARQVNGGYRGEGPPGGGRGRGGWRKPTSSYSSGGKSYQNDDSGSRWRSPPRRRSSPLRARENESPSPRRLSDVTRRGDGSPHPSEAKRPRLSRSAERTPSCPDRADKENTERLQAAGAGSRRFYGDSADAGGSRFAASQQMRPPPSPRKAGEGGKSHQLYGGKAQTASRDLQLIPAIRPLDSDKNGKDPLYIGLPNYGNSCYQNATLQSLLGLRPFLSEMVSLISGPGESGQCRTLRAVAKLMVLRQKALSKSVSSHLNDLRDVFAEIDPAFRGTEMQDANEFLLRLLDTMKDEIDARRPTDNPVRDNFQYQTVESYMCTKCHETVLKRQENISWFVSVPRRQGTEAPTLQDALRLSMRPDRRELLCQHCRHDECRVTTKISQLPRTLILQLNRYVFLGEESKKICANVGIPKFLSLNEYVADDVTRPPEWKCTKPSLCSLSDFEESEAPSSGPSPPPAGRGPSPVPAATAALPESAAAGSPVSAGAAAPARPPSPAAAAEPPPPPPAELVVLDADSESKPARTREDEDRELQEAIMRSLEEGEPADASEQARLSEFCVEDDQSLCSVDLAGDFTYRLVGVVSHYGGATHSGHYVSDVYSVGRDRWFHYDDRRVSCVDEADVLGEAGHQRNGYIFFYLHKDLCNQVVSVEGAGGSL
ncbi:ubiquitin carboxyl-terminal hydrolase 37-like [Amphibalanus amphitrite]|uniref:ubiquitin carboxyl-terminal hydrolase 37-like n=1 Tax=Amphibalanus amphitrite TaxID=1232801 RepID=UPI001C8FB1F2|nr:ubiquitin carboxyl-terminal hydrolase 37-like [Amphibalanus amphitrite]